MWKRLKHKNIVPLLGITSTPLQLISERMPGGYLTEHVREHPDTDRLGLVGVIYIVPDFTLIPTASYLISPKAFTFSTPTT